MQAHCLAKPGTRPDNPWEHELIEAVDGSYRLEGLRKKLRPEGWDE